VNGRVAALYVETNGVYFGIQDVDPWDKNRARSPVRSFRKSEPHGPHDARLYDGPWPVVAHPPELALRAVEQVRAYGGVLEHPANSKLWRAVPLPLPDHLPDAWGGRTYAIEQVAWGHPCRKPTWLYVVGVSPAAVVSSLRVGGEPTHQIWGSRRSGHRHRVDLKAAHSAMRRRTPVAFRDFLIAIARIATPRPCASCARDPLLCVCRRARRAVSA